MGRLRVGDREGHDSLPLRPLRPERIRLPPAHLLGERSTSLAEFLVWVRGYAICVSVDRQMGKVDYVSPVKAKSLSEMADRSHREPVRTYFAILRVRGIVQWDAQWISTLILERSAHRSIRRRAVGSNAGDVQISSRSNILYRASFDNSAR